MLFQLDFKVKNAVHLIDIPLLKSIYSIKNRL